MTDKVVLITGASRGIGLTTAQALTQHGYRVFGTSREPEKVDAQDFIMLPLDVDSDPSVMACVNAVREQAGRIDVLINNAGYSIYGALEETSIAEAKALFETNLFGMMRMCKAVLPIMREQRQGQIINISSIGGLIGVPYMGLYATTKYALEGYTETLRHEVKAFGIHVSLIEPGDINTDIHEPHTAQRIADYATIREQVYQAHMASMRGAPSPEIAARLIVKVIQSKKPRLRYTVGTESFVPLARRLLPLSVGEWIVRRYFKLDDVP